MVGANHSINHLLIYTFLCFIICWPYKWGFQLKLPTSTINHFGITLCIYLFLITKASAFGSFKSKYLISGFSVFTGVSIYIPLLFMDNSDSLNNRSWDALGSVSHFDVDNKI